MVEWKENLPHKRRKSNTYTCFTFNWTRRTSKCSVTSVFKISFFWNAYLSTCKESKPIMVGSRQHWWQTFQSLTTFYKILSFLCNSIKKKKSSNSHLSAVNIFLKPIRSDIEDTIGKMFCLYQHKQISYKSTQHWRRERNRLMFWSLKWTELLSSI